MTLLSSHVSFSFSPDPPKLWKNARTRFSFFLFPSLFTTAVLLHVERVLQL